MVAHMDAALQGMETRLLHQLQSALADSQRYRFGRSEDPLRAHSLLPRLSSDPGLHDSAGSSDRTPPLAPGSACGSALSSPLLGELVPNDVDLSTTGALSPRDSDEESSR